MAYQGTLQAPIQSGFGYRSTASEIVDQKNLEGFNVVVTGGYSGIGKETVRALASAGASVIVAARRIQEAHRALLDVGGTVDLIYVDLLQPASIDAFASEVAKRWNKVDILINNAAVMASPLARDMRGFETQFSANHLGHFQLTARLWPLLMNANKARVVALSSIGHRLDGMDLNDLSWETREYDKWAAYGQAKSANALFALHLDKLGERHGVRAFSVHPGGIATALQRHLTMEEQVAMGWYDEDGNLAKRFKTQEQGAATTVWAATSSKLDGMGGVYCEDCEIAVPASKETGMRSGVGDNVRDPEVASQLWQASEKMTGVPFSPE